MEHSCELPIAQQSSYLNKTNSTIRHASPTNISPPGLGHGGISLVFMPGGGGMGSFINAGGAVFFFCGKQIIRGEIRLSYLAFLRVLRSKIGKNQPGAALGHF